MKVETITQGSIVVATPHGPLTSEETGDFRAAVGDSIRERNGRVVLDMTDVPFLDSAGIEALVEMIAEAPTLQKPRMARLADACREALDLTDVLEKLDTFDTVENALRSFRQ